MKQNAIRVLVVDDSVVVRQVITDALKADPNIEVVGVAPNGKIALEKLDELKPDLITLDLEMPEMDGLTLLEQLSKRNSRLPVIVFSTLTERGAKATLEALSRGANDYLCKPSGQRSVQATMQRIREELIPKIHTLAARRKRSATGQALAGGPNAPAALHPPRLPGPVEAIAIGVSTGGPSALAEIIPALPRELPAPILIVQHMPPVFTSVLAQRLASTSKLKVREAQQRDRIEPGTVYIAPGDRHMRIAGSPREAWITLDQGEAENGCRPAVDPMFTTAAQLYGKALLALILTGVGHDGTKGAGAVRRAGGTVWIQDEATCTAWGMPSSVLEANLAQRAIPLPNIARAIIDLFAHGRPLPINPSR